jgi:asparagine synthase (glutamine-hydrolysing)
MCGIAGTVGIADESRVARMTAVLAHRGPDDHDVRFFPEEGVGLGHRRLSILDLSPLGRQPMSTPDGNLWIVFNGETYNFPDLRRELEEAGETFRSQSDTEVILRLVQREGIDGVARLNGMFALAILDRRKRRLFLARDPIGVKPLYYFRDGARFVFGSEIKAILASGLHSREPNWQGIRDYFTYLYVPTPETAFRDVHQVPPGHLLELDLDSGGLESRRYWRLRARESTGSYEEEGRVLRDVLSDSVRRQMISDVPLGVFLSGGIDSPVVTGLMAEASSRPVKTFTIVFRGKGLEAYDEAAIARDVSERFHTEHHEIPVDIGDPLEMLPLVRHFDQPFGNPTFYLMHLISRHTRSEATVALCGAGGDEIFAGYPRYRAISLAERIRWVPGPVLSGLRRILDLPRDDFRSMKLRRAREFLSGLDDDFVREFTSWTYFFDEADKNALLAPRSNGSGDAAFLRADRILRRHLSESPLREHGNRVLHLDVQTFLVDNLLEYTDKMSMAVGLEVRVPFLDTRVVEHGLNLPFAWKLRGGTGKAILRDTFRDLLPESCRNAPKKGFNVPLGIWVRDRLDSYFDRAMSRSEVERHGIFRWETIQRLREQHRAGKEDNSHELFSILMFDVWYRMYVLEEPHGVS